MLCLICLFPVLETLPADVFREWAAIFWIDNLAAKFGLQNGYSRVEDSGRIVNACQLSRLLCASVLGLNMCLASEQNIAGLPSRGAFERM